MLASRIEHFAGRVRRLRCGRPRRRLQEELALRRELHAAALPSEMFTLPPLPGDIIVLSRSVGMNPELIEAGTLDCTEGIITT
jgi:hypothetical protein